MTQEDEKYCLKALSEGNRQAFEWLFLEWQPHLVAFFSRLLGRGNEDTAADYAQDVFFDIWTSREKFSQVKSFSAYLFQMARFKVYNHFDKNAVNARYQREMTVSGPSVAPSGEAKLYASETDELIRRTLDKMPRKRREVFVMSRIQGKSNDEIAVELGINKRTVENHITNVLAALRKVVSFLILFCV
ncbi:MAG: RNA polymerase sigma-70 factor [Bacteroidales bacterium]|nr:RNA polymerase sigma-70 factor [Bacteroidales bacterium]